MSTNRIEGAIDKGVGAAKEAVGKINSFDTRTYVAIDRRFAKGAIDGLRAGKIKAVCERYGVPLASSRCSLLLRLPFPSASPRKISRLKKRRSSSARSSTPARGRYRRR